MLTKLEHCGMAIATILLLSGCNLLPVRATFPELHERQITDVDSYDGPVRWSPDGRYLAFQDRDTNVIVYDLTTSRSWIVARHGPYPNGPIHKLAWHPSGRMSYVKWRYAPGGISIDGVEELHLVDLDGRNDTLLVDNLTPYVDYLWFPDGQKLVMTWPAERSGDPIDDVYIVDPKSGQREALVSHTDLNLGIETMALLADQDILFLNGSRKTGTWTKDYFSILYDLSQRRVIKEIALDPLFASGILPGYPEHYRPTFGNFAVNYIKVGKDRWIIGDFWAPAGECYNYAVMFFDLDDTSRNFCIPSASGPTGDITVSPDGTRIAYTPTTGPGSVWVMVADLTPEILGQLKR